MILVILLTLAFAFYAQWKVGNAYTTYSRYLARSGYTGAEIAQRILDHNGITNVSIHAAPGHLVDHYDPTQRRLVLSEENFHGQSVAALGIAAHECGHALQHAQAYAPLHWRMAAVGITTMAGQLIPIVGFGSMFMGGSHLALTILAVCMGIVMLFQLITLPVEFDATARAKRILLDMGAVTPGPEASGMSRVLDAAALTYVAAFLSALGQFLMYALPLLTGRQSDEE